MCMNKVLIKIRKPKEIENAWKIPSDIIRKWKDGKNAEMMVKCGKCYECRKERGRNWTYKIWLESLNYEEKSFITLTYRDLKECKGQVQKKELQDFIKRLRYHNPNKKIKYYAAGEYGEKKGRPHYHIILLGYSPPDIKPMRGKKASNKGHLMFDSETIKKIWGKGRISVQNFHYKEVGYLTLYLDQNSKINKIYNQYELEQKKIKLNKLKEKYGLVKSVIKDNEIYYFKVKNVKDMDQIEHRKYKKEYSKMQFEMNKNPEFTLYSQGMGWENYIKKEYYKYNFILDNKILERPKEYLRKVIDNEELKQNEELYKYTIYELLERKKVAEEQYIELAARHGKKEDVNREAIKIIWANEYNKVAANNDKIRLRKIHESDF